MVSNFGPHPCRCTVLVCFAVCRSPSHRFRSEIWHVNEKQRNYKGQGSFQGSVWDVLAYRLLRFQDSGQTFNVQGLTQLCNATAGSRVPRLQCYRAKFQGSSKVPGLFRFFGAYHSPPAPEIETQKIRCWELQCFCFQGEPILHEVLHRQQKVSTCPNHSCSEAT